MGQHDTRQSRALIRSSRLWSAARLPALKFADVRHELLWVIFPEPSVPATRLENSLRPCQARI